MINIESRHLTIVQKILSQVGCPFFVFGSRITPQARRFSDLDLLYFDDIPEATLRALEEAFEESDLPYKVDIINYHQCSDDFKNIIGDRYVLLSSSDLNYNDKII